MNRNIKSIKRENLKRARATYAHHLPPKAARSPYFCPEAINQCFWKGKLPAKSSKESRVLKSIRQRTTRNERRANRMAVAQLNRMVRQDFSQQLDDDRLHDYKVFSLRESADYILW